MFVNDDVEIVLVLGVAKKSEKHWKNCTEIKKSSENIVIKLAIHDIVLPTHIVGCA